ncbi:MAG: hypothetical protein R3B95_10580 [Nitrospirales bacterium]|nr:hypothetical protein [Nitrospirales bacterium]
MKNTPVITIENHRSRERINDLGEVFTPARYVQQMLAFFDQKLWTNEDSIFFEPSCGQGNIVQPILEKRIVALTKKYSRANLNEPVIHAVANAIHTLWAIDICPINVELTRKRAFALVVKTLQTAKYDCIKSVKAREFLTHIMCTLVWQIQQNEALSAVSKGAIAETQAKKTKLGREWIKNNTHKPIDFALDWCAFYKQSTTQDAASLLFQRARQFLESSIKSDKIRGYDEFRFAREALQALSEKRRNEAMNAGVA